MKFLLAALIAASLTGVAAPSFAQTKANNGISNGIGAPVYRSALYWNQNITLDGQLTSTARTGGVASTSQSFGINTNATVVAGATVAVLPKAAISGTVTREAAIQAMDYWFQNAPNTFISTLGNYLRQKGVSHGYFNFSQEVNVSTANGVRKQVIAWSGFVDNTGKPTYGRPKLVDPDPTFIEAYYYPLRTDDELPQHWTFNAAGKLTWRVLDQRFTPLTAFKTEETAGAFDELGDSSNNSPGLNCLVDSTNRSCAMPQLSLRKIMEQQGSTGAMLRYVRQLAPLYKRATDAPEADAMDPVRTYSYEDRVWRCDRLDNSGQFGYLLHGSADYYWVSEGTPQYKAQALGSQTIEAISPTEPFTVSASKNELAGRHPASVLISPFKGRELWNIPSKEANAALSIPPIRIDPVEGEALFNPITSDVYVSSVVNGNTIDYTLGSIGDNYFGGGVHTRAIYFSLDKKEELEEFKLMSTFWDDHILLELNGHALYIGPEHQQGTHWNIGETGFDFLSMPMQVCGGGGDGGEYCYMTDPGAIGIGGMGEPEFCTVTKWVDAGDSGYNVIEPVDNRGPWVNGIHKGRGLCPAQAYLLRGKTLDQWEKGRTWGVTNNLDLRPWLVNGTNVFRVVLVVGGKGEFWFNVREKRQNCGEALGIPEGVAAPRGGQVNTVQQQLDLLNRTRHTFIN